MNAKSLVLSLALLSLPAAAAAPASAQTSAQTQAPTKIAVADPGRIIESLRETKDLQAKIKGEIAVLDEQSKQKQAELNDLRTRRDQLNPTAPQFDQLNREMLEKAINFQSWSQLNKAELERRQKNQLRSLYGKIEEVIGEVAAQQKIDLVIVRHTPEIPENMENVQMQDLRGLLNARNVLFASDAVDLTSTVIAKMDEQYQTP